MKDVKWIALGGLVVGIALGGSLFFGQRGGKQRGVTTLSEGVTLRGGALSERERRKQCKRFVANFFDIQLGEGGLIESDEGSAEFAERAKIERDAMESDLVGRCMSDKKDFPDEALACLSEADERADFLACRDKMKATREAKRDALTQEALDNLDKIYKGAAIYYTTPHINKAGAKLPCQFPASQGVTPIEGTCCSSGGLPGPDSDGDDRCDANPQVWNTDTWEALNFRIDDPHRFVYTFESSGVLVDAGFTVTAYGDLDCDGVQSTFQRMGFGDPNANFAECSLRGAPAFYVEKESE